MLPVTSAAMASKLRLASFHSLNSAGAAIRRGPSGRRSHSITMRSGSSNGSGRSSAASASANMAALAPMPSASVSAVTRSEAGRAPELPQREPHVAPPFLEPWRHSHLSSLLRRYFHASLPHALDVSRIDRLALAPPHLAVQRQLLLDFLVDRHTPQPPPQGSPDRVKAATADAGDELEPGGRFGVELAHAPGVSADRAWRAGRAPTHPIRPRATPSSRHRTARRIERTFFDGHGLAGGVFDELGDRVAVARPAGQRLENQGVERSVQQGIGVFAGIVFSERYSDDMRHSGMCIRPIWLDSTAPSIPGPLQRRS